MVTRLWCALPAGVRGKLLPEPRVEGVAKQAAEPRVSERGMQLQTHAATPAESWVVRPVQTRTGRVVGSVMQQQCVWMIPGWTCGESGRQCQFGGCELVPGDCGCSYFLHRGLRDE